MYGAVDLQVVGKFGTAADISAVSTGSQLMQTVTIVITGLSMGVTVLLGQKHRARARPEEAGRAVGGRHLPVRGGDAADDGRAAGGHAASWPPSCTPRRTPLPARWNYIRICSAGAVFIVAYNLLGSVFRGLGDSRMPLITVTIACVCNIVGDLLLVGGFGTGRGRRGHRHGGGPGGQRGAVHWRSSAGGKLPFTMTRRDVRFDGNASSAGS